MGKNVVQKILDPHIVEGKPIPGQEVAIRIDQTLTQDATGTMAYLQFEAMGLDAVRAELSVSYVDHNTIQVGFENADDHRYLQTVAAKYGIVYSRAGNGICHQVHLERFGRPGKTLLGSDSHTPTGGGVGMFAVGAGGLDVAVAMGGGPFYVTYPKVCLVRLTGQLQPWVSAKDVILKMLEIFSTKGNVGWVMEYGGPGAATLSVPERATITNMGAEMGVTTSVFPSDEETRRFLKAQGREDQWVEIVPDPDAAYDKVVDLDLRAIEPLAAYPHSPGNIKPVRELAGMAVNQVEIGSCTNSSYKDMITVAHILKGQHAHPSVSFAVAPGSRQVLQMLAREGALGDLLDAGARIMESACGFCIGNSQSPQTTAVSLRTSNRNFEGRSGTKDAQVYLVSPETAAAAVITGEFTDPRDLDMPYPKVDMPEAFLIDDSMFILPEQADKDVAIYRGPNIGDPPRNDALPADIVGAITIKVGDKITTDHIIPAGARMKYRSNVPKYAEFVFENVDPAFYQRAKATRDQGEYNLIVAGESYGQGSSREHAALCPMYLGVKAVVAKSFERIHIANLINFGIVPLTFKDEADYEKIAAGDAVEIPDIRGRLQRGEDLVLADKTQGIEIPLAYNFSDRQRDILLAGGTLNYVVS
ncbi:MAG: aconitate hydratase [Chloroflexi bacterium]|nr:aconitate hydratase [Chloroflexota bacterium]MBU1750639.1 aconitate hydratase [Chloroflexota bacterium]